MPKFQFLVRVSSGYVRRIVRYSQRIRTIYSHHWWSFIFRVFSFWADFFDIITEYSSSGKCRELMKIGDKDLPIVRPHFPNTTLDTTQRSRELTKKYGRGTTVTNTIGFVQINRNPCIIFNETQTLNWVIQIHWSLFVRLSILSKFCFQDNAEIYFCCSTLCSCV